MPSPAWDHLQEGASAMPSECSSTAFSGGRLLNGVICDSSGDPLVCAHISFAIKGTPGSVAVLRRMLLKWTRNAVSLQIVVLAKALWAGKGPV